MNSNQTKITKALAPFPGIALRGETRGTICGSLCAIALIYEGKDPDKRNFHIPDHSID